MASDIRWRSTTADGREPGDDDDKRAAAAAREASKKMIRIGYVACTYANDALTGRVALRMRARDDFVRCSFVRSLFASMIHSTDATTTTD